MVHSIDPNLMTAQARENKYQAEVRAENNKGIVNGPAQKRFKEFTRSFAIPTDMELSNIMGGLRIYEGEKVAKDGKETKDGKK